MLFLYSYSALAFHNTKRLMMDIGVKRQEEVHTSFGSSQIFRFPHPTTEAAKRFCVVRLLQKISSVAASYVYFHIDRAIHSPLHQSHLLFQLSASKSEYELPSIVAVIHVCFAAMHAMYRRIRDVVCRAVILCLFHAQFHLFLHSFDTASWPASPIYR